MTTAIELTGNEEHFVKIRKYVDQIINKKEKYSILDGGGTLHTYKFLCQIFPNSEIISLNNRHEDIANCKNAVIGDLELLPHHFEECSFDIIFATDIIEHLFNPDYFLDGCEYCMKNDGYLIVTTPNLADYINRLFLLLGFCLHNYDPSLRYRCGNPFIKTKTGIDESLRDAHKSIFTYKGLTHLFQLHNFKIVYKTGYAYTGCSTKKHAHEKLRTYLNTLMPKGLREGILLIGKYQKDE